MPQRLKSLMSSSQELSAIFSTVQTLTELQRHFSQVVPVHFAQSAQILSLRHGTLSIAMSNGALAAKLRQLAPEIVNSLQNRGCEVSGIRVKVQVNYAPVIPKRTPRLLSSAVQHELTALSSQLGDTPLGHALEKLAEK